jgi:Transposase DDE domain group 1
MPTECSQGSSEFASLGSRRVTAAFDGGQMTSNAGALLLREADGVIGLSRQVAACFRDGRRQDRVEHAVETLVAQRIHGLALGYEDLNDHDELRHDPVLGLVSGKLEARRTDCAVLAGKSTLNRLEHAPRADDERYRKLMVDEEAMKRLFVSLFLKGQARPPQRIVLDLDATDDPIHGDQEGRFFHGYYKCYCYLPLYVFCGRELLLAKLRPANIDAAAGAKDEIAWMVAQIRERWPDVEIWLRADSGFCREELMGWCEDNGVEYVFGLARNARLEAEIAEGLAEPKRRKAARRRGRSRTYATKPAKAGHASAGSWPRPNICRKAPIRASS